MVDVLREVMGGAVLRAGAALERAALQPGKGVAEAVVAIARRSMEVSARTERPTIAISFTRNLSRRSERRPSLLRGGGAGSCAFVLRYAKSARATAP